MDSTGMYNGVQDGVMVPFPHNGLLLAGLPRNPLCAIPSFQVRMSRLR